MNFEVDFSPVVPLDENQPSNTLLLRETEPLSRRPSLDKFGSGTTEVGDPECVLFLNHQFCVFCYPEKGKKERNTKN